jgi:hypothetical protein
MRENKKGNAELAPHKASAVNKAEIEPDGNWNFHS